MNPIKILFVDDDRSLHELVKIALAPYGTTLLFAEDSPDALHLAQQERPNIIVMDLLLPSEMKGWDVIATLKRDPATQHIQIIAMTASSGDKLALAMQVGADAMLQKPFSIAQLRQMIEQYLSAANA